MGVGVGGLSDSQWNGGEPMKTLPKDAVEGANEIAGHFRTHSGTMYHNTSIELKDPGSCQQSMDLPNSFKFREITQQLQSVFGHSLLSNSTQNIKYSVSPNDSTNQ